MAEIELILTGNGPGELTGWIAPVARAARRLAETRGIDMRLTLALSPSQFSGGRELEVVERWALFDRVLPPATVTRLALGIGRLDLPARAALVHLGGDLWISARVARRFRIPAAALAETGMVASRHRNFARIFAVSEEVANRLTARSVPLSKVSVTGDPRSDAVVSQAGSANGRRSTAGDRYVLSFLPGSRDRFFAVLVPYFMRAAGALAARGRRVSLQVIVSEFLSPGLVDNVRRAVASQWGHLAIDWITNDPWRAIRQSDLVMTIPGTNTLELALVGVPFAVVLDERLLYLVPLEGALEWLTRMPGAGPLLRRWVVKRAIGRLQFVALPNARARRMVVPEWIGRWAPDDLAKRVAALLDDRPRRETIRTDLQSLRLSRPGAAGRVAEMAIALSKEDSVRS